MDGDVKRFANLKFDTAAASIVAPPDAVVSKAAVALSRQIAESRLTSVGYETRARADEARIAASVARDLANASQDKSRRLREEVEGDVAWMETNRKLAAEHFKARAEMPVGKVVSKAAVELSEKIADSRVRSAEIATDARETRRTAFFAVDQDRFNREITKLETTRDTQAEQARWIQENRVRGLADLNARNEAAPAAKAPVADQPHGNEDVKLRARKAVAAAAALAEPAVPGYVKTARFEERRSPAQEQALFDAMKPLRQGMITPKVAPGSMAVPSDAASANAAPAAQKPIIGYTKNYSVPASKTYQPVGQQQPASRPSMIGGPADVIGPTDARLRRRAKALAGVPRTVGAVSHPNLADAFKQASRNIGNSMLVHPLPSQTMGYRPLGAPVLGGGVQPRAASGVARPPLNFGTNPAFHQGAVDPSRNIPMQRLPEMPRAAASTAPVPPPAPAGTAPAPAFAGTAPVPPGPPLPANAPTPLERPPVGNPAKAARRAALQAPHRA